MWYRQFMAASDHLEPKLFHGTGHWFAPGEIVEPRRDNAYGDGGGAYATTDIEVAHAYAKGKAVGSIHDDELHQMALFAPIYEVEHLSKHSDPSRTLGRNIRRDTKGFRPVRIVGYANWND